VILIIKRTIPTLPMTNYEYDTGLEEATTTVWRQAAFHIIGSAVHGRPKLDKSHVHYQCN
jgi:hypothetical protein